MNGETEKLSCSICGEDNDEVYHTLKCNHTFHYKCLLLSFKNMKTNECPYCRSKGNLLPIIDGLKTLQPLIHCQLSDYKIKKCNHLLTRGKNKGNQCSKGCKLGYQFCTTHYKNHIKDGGQIVV